MEQVILLGGSVLHEGKLHTRVDTLPSRAELAQTDEEKAVADADIDALIARLEAQKSKNAKPAGGKSLTGGEETKTGDEETQEILMKLTRAELVERAKQENVAHEENATKAEIVAAILTPKTSE